MAQEKKRWLGPDAEYIVPLYRLLISNSPFEKVADWLAVNGLRYSNQLVRRTLKMAKREDLIPAFIKEMEVSLGDTVKSRWTARIGKVVGIHSDGDTIDVRWETGGIQPLSKESVFKLISKDIKDSGDMAKLHTDLEPYKEQK